EREPQDDDALLDQLARVAPATRITLDAALKQPAPPMRGCEHRRLRAHRRRHRLTIGGFGLLGLVAHRVETSVLHRRWDLLEASCWAMRRSATVANSGWASKQRRWTQRRQPGNRISAPVLTCSQVMTMPSDDMQN